MYAFNNLDGYFRQGGTCQFHIGVGMSIIGWIAFGVAALLLIGIVRGSSSIGGESLDEDNPNQFVQDELDPRNPNNLMLRCHRDDDFEEPLFHANASVED